jgi:hypothetical protein
LRVYVVDAPRDDVERSLDIGVGLLDSVDPGMKIVEGPPKTIEGSMKTIERPTWMRDRFGLARAPAPSNRAGSSRVVGGALRVIGRLPDVVDDDPSYT